MINDDGRNRAPMERSISPSTAAAVMAFSGAGLSVFSIATFIWVPQERLTDLTGLLLTVGAIIGFWITISAARSLAHLVASVGSPEPRRDSEGEPPRAERRETPAD